MNQGKIYKTRQRELVLQCMKEHEDDYTTIQQIMQWLTQKEEKIGLTTIYRTLDKLVIEKKIAKVHIDGVNGTCYRYLPEKKSILFFLKCEQCGNIVDVRCPELAHLYEHVSEEHHVLIDPGKTMFYGRCDKCQKKA